MKKNFLNIYILMTLCVSASLGMEGDHEAQDLVDRVRSTDTNAFPSIGLAKKAISLESGFRRATVAHLEERFEKLEELKANSMLGDDVLRTAVLEGVQRDKQFATQLTDALKPFDPYKSEVSFPVKFHKTTDILGLMGPLLAEETFYQVLDGKVPQGYEYHQDSVTILGDDRTIWGNSKGTALKTLLMYMLVHRDTKISQPVPQSFGNLGLVWFHDSLAHIYPLPQGLDIDLSFSFAAKFTATGDQAYLVVPHSGYAFGGGRSQLLYPQGKPNEPIDCSSFMSKITGGHPWSTADQLCAFRLKQGFDYGIPKGWEQGTDAQDLLQNYSVVPIKDPQDIKPGHVMAYRNFNLTTDPEKKGLGSGGHTAVVVGVKRDGTVLSMGANRDMPKLEGIGLQEVSWNALQNRTYMVFDHMPVKK